MIKRPSPAVLSGENLSSEYDNYVASVHNLALWRKSYLRRFLGGRVNIDFPGMRSRSYPRIGWGRKASGIGAQRLAHQLDVPCLLLEDGFVRSLGLGVLGYTPHSAVLDSTGIYYDVSAPSDLENLIIASSLLNGQALQRAAVCIDRIKSNQLSKYNHSTNTPLKLVNGKYSVLIVDQTYGDASVSYGGADQTSFWEMLKAAIAEHPDAKIIVKIHPDVIAGKKQGHLLELAREHGCTVLSEDISPWAVFDQVEHVYVVTSQLGFEGLLAGKKVTCFGMPFYAGWGLTDDRQTCDRRSVSRTLEQVFYAAYIQYCRYINPYTGVRCELEDTIRLITTQKMHLERHRGNWSVFGFSKWKKRFIPDFLGIGATVRFVDKPEEVSKQVASGDNLLVWSSRVSAAQEVLCANNGLKMWRMEDGFLRSVGLGADLVRPLSLVIDASGIYYDSSQPSDLENLLNNHNFDSELLLRAAKVREQLVQLRLSKYNVGVTSGLALPTDKRVVLVPGQVETDASIAKGSPVIQTNYALLEAVRSDNPDAFIIYKPHPDVLSGGRYGELSDAASGLYDQLITDISITDLFDVIDEVHTMSSLSGFEALLRNKRVVTYGLPFYSGWGLTEDKLSCERRSRNLTLDQLVAATLILYPIYVEPDSGQVCDIETIIHILHQRQGQVQGPSIKTRLYRAYRSVFEGKR